MTEGYTDTGMEVVARHAAVSTATLYAHFPSKADLFRTTVEEMITDIANGVARDPGPGADARSRLTAFARTYAQFCANPMTRAVLRMICAEGRRFTESAETVQARSRSEIGGAVIKMVTELAARGELAVDKPSWAASQLLGMIEHSTLLYGLVKGDDAAITRPTDALAEDAVMTFLARYGVRETAG